MKPAPIQEKYNFNLYDTVVAWTLSDYVAAHKNALESVVAGGKLDGKELADLLDAAVSWVKEEHRDCEEKLVGMMDAALDGFDGTRYVQAMDAGFCRICAGPIWEMSERFKGRQKKHRSRNGLCVTFH